MLCVVNSAKSCTRHESWLWRDLAKQGNVTTIVVYDPAHIIYAMPTLEEVSPNVAELTKNVNPPGIKSENNRNLGLDDESDDEFHDACDRVSNPREREDKDE